MNVHHIARATFDRFCAGAVDEETVALLRNGQYSRRRLLLAALVDAMAEDGPDSAEPAWQVLVTADEMAPDVVEDVLMAPSTGTWLARALSADLRQERGYLHSLAAAVAIRAGLTCELTVPVVRGVVTWPTVGQVRFADARTGGTPVTIAGGHVDRPSRYVPACRHGSVTIDDRTPYRRFQAPEDPRPLARDELTAWRTRLDEAWQLLTRWHPGYADELSAGFTTLVPIPRPTRVVGSSSKTAFGAIAMSEPASPADMAAVLVHEFQHSKLNAVLDLVVLHTGAEDERYYAPWRDDPRPLTGLLHGIYAFTGNVEFWYVQSRVTGARAAVVAFAHRHLQVRAAVESLADADDLTDLGRELVDAAARRLSACPLDDVPSDVLTRLRARMADHHARFTRR